METAEKLDKKREEMIASMVHQLDMMKEKMIFDRCCRLPGCNELHLGALVKSMRLVKLDPPPLKPYHGICISDIQSLIPRYEQLADRRRIHHGRTEGQCGCAAALWLASLKEFFNRPLSLDKN